MDKRKTIGTVLIAVPATVFIGGMVLAILAAYGWEGVIGIAVSVLLITSVFVGLYLLDV